MAALQETPLLITLAQNSDIIQYNDFVQTFSFRGLDEMKQTLLTLAEKKKFVAEPRYVTAVAAVRQQVAQQIAAVAVQKLALRHLLRLPKRRQIKPVDPCQSYSCRLSVRQNFCRTWWIRSCD